MEDLLVEDFENLLMNREEADLYLRKLKDNCRAFSTKVEARVQELISKSSEYSNQIKNSHETIVQLSNEKKDLKSSLENVKLEKKLVEKKTIKAIEEIEKTKSEIDSIKETKEKLLLEMVDLEEELNKSKEYMKKQWDAVKRANKVYKDILDIRIDTDTINDVEHVTVTFFWCENPTDKSFYVILTNKDDCWKVKKIEPELSTEHKYQLHHVVQFSKESEVFSITALLSALRNLFLKLYFEK